MPAPHRLKRLLKGALMLFVLVHLAYWILAYSRLSLGRALLLGVGIVILMLLCYGALAYLVLPWLWSRHYRGRAQFSGLPKITRTKEGIPGDPLNVGLVGSDAELIDAMLAAQWLPADPASAETVLGIVKNILFHRPDPKAPVSNLFLQGRKQDLAFERLEGTQVKQRHHVRFWKGLGRQIDGRPLWIGAASFDVGYRASRYTGQILHRIDPEIDAERDRLMADLKQAKQLLATFETLGIGLTLRGRNGEGDWYYTDGQMLIGSLVPAGPSLDNPS